MGQQKKSAKVDRKRKSVQAVAYKAGRRSEINKKKNIARHAKRMEAKAKKRQRWEERKRKQPKAPSTAQPLPSSREKVVKPSPAKASTSIEVAPITTLAELRSALLGA